MYICINQTHRPPCSQANAFSILFFRLHYSSPSCLHSVARDLRLTIEIINLHFAYPFHCRHLSRLLFLIRIPSSFSVASAILNQPSPRNEAFRLFICSDGYCSFSDSVHLDFAFFIHSASTRTQLNHRRLPPRPPISAYACSCCLRFFFPSPSLRHLLRGMIRRQISI